MTFSQTSAFDGLMHYIYCILINAKFMLCRQSVAYKLDVKLAYQVW